MGFITGVITGIAAAAVAAAWYLSRSGERIRTQYRVEQRLAQLGDELEARTRDIQTALTAQLAELRGASGAASGQDGTWEPVATNAPARGPDAAQPPGGDAGGGATSATEAGPGATLDPAAATAAEAEAAAAAAVDEPPTRRPRKPKARAE